MSTFLSLEVRLESVLRAEPPMSMTASFSIPAMKYTTFSMSMDLTKSVVISRSTTEGLAALEVMPSLPWLKTVQE